MALDLTGLPDVRFVDTDTAKVESAILTLWEGITNSVLFQGSPERLFLSTLAYIIAQRNVLLDYTGKQNMLRYAEKEFLDHLGAWLGVERLPASPALTVARFTLQEPRPNAVLIPAGTRITADGVTYFATDGLLVIPAGAEYADIAATCQKSGKEWNGIAPGDINKMVDPQPFVKSVENLYETSGGADTEDDESLRYRINLKPESFSTAGPELAYVYWTLSAHPDISDASVISPLPGVVNVFALLNGGRIPDIEGPEIKAIENILITDNKIRPFTDFVTILPVDAHEIDYHGFSQQPRTLNYECEFAANTSFLPRQNALLIRI